MPERLPAGGHDQVAGQLAVDAAGGLAAAVLGGGVVDVHTLGWSVGADLALDGMQVNRAVSQDAVLHALVVVEQSGVLVDQLAVGDVAVDVGLAGGVLGAREHDAVAAALRAGGVGDFAPAFAGVALLKLSLDGALEVVKVLERGGLAAGRGGRRLVLAPRSRQAGEQRGDEQ